MMLTLHPKNPFQHINRYLGFVRNVHYIRKIEIEAGFILFYFNFFPFVGLTRALPMCVIISCRVDTVHSQFIARNRNILNEAG